MSGAANVGAVSCATIARIAAILMEQWCVPFRLQQAGRFTSSLPLINGDKGINPNTSIRTMEKPRRICHSWYTIYLMATSRNLRSGIIVLSRVRSAFAQKN